MAAVGALDRESLITVLTQPKNALVKQYHRIFELDGVDLEFTDAALERAADMAVKTENRGSGIAVDIGRGVDGGHVPGALD